MACGNLLSLLHLLLQAPSMFNPRSTAAFYRDLLLTNILPWWQRHAIDRENGGLCSCIRDDGTIVSRDKYVWSQVRAVWSFAAAYNRVKRDPAFLAMADDLFDFSVRHGINADDDWNFLLAADGSVKQGPQSIQTDAFAICAMVEYAIASGRQQAVDVAMRSYRRTRTLIAQPGSYKTDPYPIPPGVKAQRVSMQFSLAYWELAKFTGDDAIRRDAMLLCDDVLDNFRRPELQASLEYMNLDNTVPAPPVGTYISPGHGIETAWFQIENLRHTGNGTRLAKALDIMRWNFERGWDTEFGGLFLGMDLNGGEPYLPNGDTKIWWPHCEALCGALMAHEISGEPWCLNWHDRTLAWSLEHFPVAEHGEWTQRLDRQGRKIDRVVALPVKDPFHLPRALIYAFEACDRMAARTSHEGKQ